MEHQNVYTCVAFMLSRWNWHIFPRAETALSYAITLSESCAFGCLITASNLESASAVEHNKKIQKIYIQLATAKQSNGSGQLTSNKGFENRSAKLSTNTNTINSSLQRHLIIFSILTLDKQH